MLHACIHVAVSDLQHTSAWFSFVCQSSPCMDVEELPKSGLAERACKVHAWPKLSRMQIGVSIKRAEVLEDDSCASRMSVLRAGDSQSE